MAAPLTRVAAIIVLLVNVLEVHSFWYYLWARRKARLVMVYLAR